MLEEKKTNELKDEDLEEVSGGTTLLILFPCNKMKSPYIKCSEYNSLSEARQTCKLK